MKRTVLIALAAMFTMSTLAFAQARPAPAPAQTAAPTGTPGTGVGPNFIDADGDGICDNFQARAGQKRGGGYGPGDGTGHRMGPRDGTGYGPGARGTCPNCTGTDQGNQTHARRGPRQ